MNQLSHAVNATSWIFFGACGAAALVAAVSLILAAGLFRKKSLAVAAAAWVASYLASIADFLQHGSLLGSHKLAPGPMVTNLLFALAALISIHVQRGMVADTSRSGSRCAIANVASVVVFATSLAALLLEGVLPLWGMAQYIAVFAILLVGIKSMRNAPRVAKYGAALSLIAFGLAVGKVSAAGIGSMSAAQTSSLSTLALSGVIQVALVLSALSLEFSLKARSIKSYAQRVDALEKRLAQSSEHRQRLQEQTRELLRTRATLRHALNAEQRLLLEQRQFFAMISHEFRTPLAIADAVAAAQIRFPAEDSSEQVGRGQRIRRAIGRLTALVNNCLVDERLASGGFSLQVQDVAIPELVTLSCELVVLNSLQKLQTDSLLAPPTWPCDPTLLRIAISNLVDNAAKYSRRGCIRVMAAEVDNELVVSVSDDGPGLPPVDRSRVFRAFERGRHSDEGGGFGFGLYVTRKIARLHGGEAGVVNSYMGGSVFHLRLPRPASPKV